MDLNAKAIGTALFCFVVFATFSFSHTASAQAVQLTSEQQRILDQLPPEQRRQALAAIRDARSGASGDQTSTLVEEQSSGPAPVEEERPRERGTRIAANGQLVLDFSVKEGLPEEIVASIDENMRLRFSGRRFYELDGDGVLSLPGLAGIPLLGLTTEQIELRLGAEPALGFFDIAATILDIDPVAAGELQPFGYDVFQSDIHGFDPVTSGPVPPDYVLGPGDSVRVQYYGNVNGIYEFEVSRDGVLNLPELGPVTVAGLPFSEFREDIDRRVREMLIGTQVSATMGQLRTMRVFVLGDVNRPGSHVVSSLATVSSALYASGGVSPIGSLRDVQLKRDGDTVSRLDLYDLLLEGDTSGDSRLQPGDVVFVPPVGAQVGVGGAVKRPAIYEVAQGSSIADAIDLAGGLAADAFPAGARIERIDAGRGRLMISVDAERARSTDDPVVRGDRIFIPNVLPDLEDTVLLSGHVQRPGPYEWSQGMHLSDLIPSHLELKPGADSEYVLIRREDERDRTVQVVSASLSEALTERRTSRDPLLRPKDTVHVFDLAFDRQRIVGPILDDLRRQARFGQPYREVSVTGKVFAPGAYPLEHGMRVSDLIRAGGNLSEEAYTLTAELVRYDSVSGRYRSTEMINFDLEAALRGVESADLVLEEHDSLRISGLPEWDTMWSVRIEGEVTFPGDYRIRRGETLASVLERAGGLTDAAFPEGAVFLRESLRAREQEQLEALARRLEADITSLSLETLDTTGSQTLATGQELLAQLRNTEAVGRLVIDVEHLVSTSPSRQAVDLELRDRDRLLIPKQAQEVTVLGETQQNTSHLYRPELNRDDYIRMSGGLTRRADKALIYVVRASGAVVTKRRSRWFGRAGSESEIQPGDTIVVPLETDRIRPLTFWTNVTQILYQAAIAVAAIETFGN